MPIFIDIDHGSINLDHVARVTCNQVPLRDTTRFCFYGTAGAALGSLTTVADVDLVEITAPVVPAAAGTVAVLITVIPESRGTRPTPDDVWVERVPIVAWRLCHGGARPVLIEQSCSNESALIEMPDGRLLSAGDCTYGDLNGAKAAILADCQREWDRQHTAEVVS
jgi:hypothetical protein